MAPTSEDETHRIPEDDAATLTLRTDNPVVLDAAPFVPLEFGRRYVTEQLLGEGGMGVVMLCRDGQIGRRIALKRLIEGEADELDASRGRFVREARIQGQLEHPAIPPVYDLGVDPDGAVYFTMKRVQGKTLREILRILRDQADSDGRYSLRRLLTAFSNACLAVDFAHRRGVVHRDIKPSNIMLGDYGEVYVLDWGIARPMSTEPEPEAPPGADPRRVEMPADSHVTRHRGLLGTPGYASPEQVSSGLVGPQSDVYSLGATLFQMLTLKRLHSGRAADAVATTVTGVEARPTLRAPERNIPPEMDEICHRATALNTANRYRTARELSDAIERYLDGQRDEERRHEMAERHVQEAHESLGSSGSAVDQLANRRAALSAIGRALAIDPGNANAMAAMVQLLQTPPSQVPDAVREKMVGRAREYARWSGRVSGIAYASLLLYVPLLLWAGVRSSAWMITFYVLGLASAGAAWFVAHGKRGPLAGVIVAMVLSTAAFAATAWLFGAVVLTPGLVAVNTAAYALVLHGRWRILTVCLGLCAVLVPGMLELFGAIGPHYAFDSAGMRIIPSAIELSPIPTLLILYVASVANVLTGVVAISRIRDAHMTAEQRLVLQAWHLDQLAPGSRDGMVSVPPPAPA